MQPSPLEPRCRPVCLALSALIAAALGCADARRPSRIGAIFDSSDAGSLPEPDAAADANTPGAAGQTGSDAGPASAGRGGAAGGGSDLDPPCGRAPEPVPCTGSTPIGYTASVTRSPDDPFECVPIGGPGCWSEPPPFATLSACVAACEPEVAGDETLCEAPGGNGLACELDAGTRAFFEARTPFGPLALTQAWLSRSVGFTDGVRVTFTLFPEPDLDGIPTASFFLNNPIAAPALTGTHDVMLAIALCDRRVELPVRVTITADELISGASERFEGTIESLAPDIGLRAEFSFNRICAVEPSL